MRRHVGVEQAGRAAVERERVGRHLAELHAEGVRVGVHQRGEGVLEDLDDLVGAWVSLTGHPATARAPTARLDDRPRRPQPDGPQLEPGEPVDDRGSPRRQAPAGSASTRASTCSGWWAIARSANRSRSAPASRNRWPAVARGRRRSAGAGRTTAGPGSGSARRPARASARGSDGVPPAAVRRRTGPWPPCRRRRTGSAPVARPAGTLGDGPAGVAQPVGEVAGRGVDLVPGRGQPEGRVVDLVRDLDPDPDPEHDGEVPDDLAGCGGRRCRRTASWARSAPIGARNASGAEFPSAGMGHGPSDEAPPRRLAGRAPLRADPGADPGLRRRRAGPGHPDALLVWEPRRLVPVYAVPVHDLTLTMHVAEPQPEPWDLIGVADDAGPRGLLAAHRPRDRDGPGGGVAVTSRAPGSCPTTVTSASGWCSTSVPFDAWWAEDEELFGHPHDPFKRIDVLASSRARSRSPRRRRARLDLSGP